MALNDGTIGNYATKDAPYAGTETLLGDDGGTTKEFAIAQLVDDVQTKTRALAEEFTKSKNFDMATLTDVNPVAWNLEDAQVAQVTLGGSRTLQNPTNQKAGGTYILIVKQDATGSRTLSFGADYAFPEGVNPTLTTTANAVDVLSFVSDGTTMYGVFQGNFG